MIDLLSFLDQSPTSIHAALLVKEELLSAGFTLLDEGNEWKLEPGGRYVTLRGGSLAAFILPEEAPKEILLIGAHTDSPALKLKPEPEYVEEEMTLLATEIYGSPLLTSWMNRDLGVAGRLFVLEGGKVKEELILSKERPVTIPQLAIHLDREASTKGVLLNKQEHLSAFAGKGPYLETLAKGRKLLSHDLFFFPLEPARKSEDTLFSYRIDNLASVFAALSAFAFQKAHKNRLSITLFWDHEEIGSATQSGASSPFGAHLLERILGRETLLRLLPSSLAVSCDLAHAYNPNYSARYEPRHRIHLGGGIAIKYSASQRYATDAKTASLIESVCINASLPYQKFVTHSEIPSGSTIGPLHATVTGMPTVDIGIPQLSMHSAREICSLSDLAGMTTLLTELFSK